MAGRLLAVCGIALVACKGSGNSPTTGSGSGSGSSMVAVAGSGSSAPVPVAPVHLEAKPTELVCGELDVPVPKVSPSATPPAARPLAKTPALAGCKALASPDALCKCLDDKVDALGLHAPVECKPLDQDAGGGVFAVQSSTGGLDGGGALVFAAKHDAQWTAVAVLERTDAIDRGVQPNASNVLKTTELVSRPHGDSTLYWIATRNESQDKSSGEADRSGTSQGSVCLVGASDTCFEPVILAAWNYSYPVFEQAGKCTVSSVEVYRATLDGNQLRVELVGGKADAGKAATYTIDPNAAGSGSGSGSATPEIPFGKSDECVAIVTKIKACQKDPAFAKALDADGHHQKRNAKLRKQIDEWPQPWPTCNEYFSWAFEVDGFLKDPDVLIADHVLDSCETLGVAIRNAGGLPGGRTAN